MSLLVFGKSTDPHVKSVCQFLDSRHQIQSLIIDHSQLLDFSVCLTSDLDKFLVCYKSAPLTNITAIWDRNKLSMPAGGIGDDFRSEYVCVGQWLAFYRGIIELMKVRVINRPSTSVYSKFAQLEIAKSVGFKVPPTIVPSSAEDVFREMNTNGPLILKAMAYALTPTGDGASSARQIVTTRVTANELESIDEEIRVAPHLFQQEIIKQYELRIVCTHEEYFAFSTDAHRDELTRVDWRYGNGYLEFKARSLPLDVIERLRKYMRASGIVYGVFDIIVDPEDEYWFLECNFEGQWAWLEEKYHAGIPQSIAKAIASVF